MPCTKTYITNSVHLPNKINTAHAQLFRNQTSLLPSRQRTTRYKDADGELPVSYDNITHTYISTHSPHPNPHPHPPKKYTKQQLVTTSDFYLRGPKIHSPRRTLSLITPTHPICQHFTPLLGERSIVPPAVSLIKLYRRVRNKMENRKDHINV